MRVMLLMLTSVGFIVAASAAFGLYLLDGARRHREPLWASIICMLIGVGAATLAGVINSAVLPNDIYAAPLLTSAVQVGLVPATVEELAKIIPLMIFITVQSFFRDIADGVIFFAFSGLAFGVYENIDYAMRFGPAVGVSRLVSLLFFHAATAGVFGYFFAKARRDQSWLTVVAVLGFMIFIHASYNFLLVLQLQYAGLRWVAGIIPLAMTGWLAWTLRRAQQLDRQARGTRSQ